jgi:hypothetical protein
MTDDAERPQSARQLPLIGWDALRGVEPADIGRLVEQWQGPGLPVDPAWPGDFATEAFEMEVGTWVGHLAILVISMQDADPVDDRFYLVVPPAGPIAVALFRETDYVAMFELASSPQAHRAVPASQCTVVGRVTYLIAPL